MTPLARRLAAKLQAARRPLTGDRQLKDEPSDDTMRMTRLPAAAENVCHSSTAHRDLEKKKKEMRRAVCDTKPRTAALMNQVFAQQTQQQNAAGMQLHPAAEGGAAEGDREIFEEPLETAQQVQPEQLAAGEQRHEQDDQQGARGAHTGGRPEMYPQNGDSCLGTAVSVVQERGVGVGVEYTTAQERGDEGSRASEGRGAAQEKAQLEADAARAGSRNSVCEKCESEQGTAVSNDSSDEAAERPRTALQHNRKADAARAGSRRWERGR
jgi:hypothetical protein